MEIINSKTIASVEVATIKATVDELAVLEAILSHALQTLNTDELEQRFGATQDEIEAMRDDLRAYLTVAPKETRKPVLA